MITSEATGLALKIANGLIKLTHRVDLVLAERAAVTGPLALVQPDVILAQPPEKMIPALRKLLADTEGEDPDPLGLDRPGIAQLVAHGASPGQDDLVFFMEKHLPEQAIGRTIQLNSSLMREVAKARPDWDLSDPEVRVAAFAISPGRDQRQKGYTWRLALTVVDVLAEFGAENTVLFTRDEKLQEIAGAVLKRFGEADLATADSWEGVLRATLRATLNGALDAREFYDVDDRWIGGLLDALYSAREQVPEAKQDQFLLGLVGGHGYPLLVGALLESAATQLSAEDADVVDKIAAEILREAATRFQGGGQFKFFLRDHWGDLLRAGIGSIADHGALLLEDESPLVREVLIGLIRELSATPNHKFLTSDTLIGLADAAISAVAAKPQLIADAVNQEWLAVLVRSVTGTVSTQGVRNTFDRQGLEAILTGALGSFAEHPELIIDKPDLAQELLRGVLTQVSGVDRLTASSLATAAIEGALTTLAARPDLIESRYSELVAALAGKVAALVEEKSLTRVQGADLLRALTESLAENPTLFLDLENKLAGTVVDAVMRVSAGSSGGLLASVTVVKVMRSVLDAMAKSGKAALASRSLEQLAQELESVLDAGLVRTEKELGNRLSLTTVPDVLEQLVVAWARGEIATIDPQDQNFKRLFAELADRAVA